MDTTPPGLARRLRRAFGEAPLRRGRVVEELLGSGDLAANYPLFDRPRYLGGGRFELTSIKTRDLRAPSYRRLSAFERRVRRDVDMLARFERIPQWQHSARKISLIELNHTLVGNLVLEVVVCGAELHDKFAESVARLEKYASGRGVKIRFIQC